MFPYPAPQLAQAVAALMNVEQAKSLVGKMYGQGWVGTQQDVDNAILGLDAVLGNSALTQPAIANFEAWTAGLLDPDLIERAAEAAVAGWSSLQFAAYLNSMMQAAPSQALSALYSHVLGSNAPPPAPLPGQHTQVITIPRGLILTNTGGKAPTKPTSTATKVAVGAGAAGVAAAIAVTMVAWAKGESIGFIMKKIWKAVT